MTETRIEHGWFGATAHATPAFGVLCLSIQAVLGSTPAWNILAFLLPAYTVFGMVALTGVAVSEPGERRTLATGRQRFRRWPKVAARFAIRASTCASILTLAAYAHFGLAFFLLASSSMVWCVRSMLDDAQKEVQP